MNNKIAFIGAGHLAESLIAGFVRENNDSAAVITASNRSEGKLNALKDKYNVNITLSNQEAAAGADFVFITVKPNDYDTVLGEIKDSLNKRSIVITPGAGVSIAFTESILGESAKVVRTMPNTPSMLGAGMNAICAGNNVDKADLDRVYELFSKLGRCEIVEEKLFDTVTGVSGSGPAYVYMFIDAMANAAEKDGMPREQAVAFAAQTALGAARMVLETGEDPKALCDSVCSPGGTTIEAVNIFKEEDLYGLVEKAQHACVKKSESMH